MKRESWLALGSLGIVLMVACGPGRRPLPPPVSTQRDVLIQADQAFEAGDLAQAAALYDQHIRSGNPARRDHALFRRGWISAYQGDCGNALKNLELVEPRNVSQEKRTQIELLKPLLTESCQGEAENKRLKAILERIRKLQ